MVGPKHSIAGIFYLSIFLDQAKKNPSPEKFINTIGEAFEFDF